MPSGNPGRVIVSLIMWAALGTGILCLGGALISAHLTQQFLRTSVTAEARIVALKPVRVGQDNSVSYAPVFRFDVPGTHFATVVSNTSSKPPAFKVGETVTVHYQQGHPEKAVIDSFGQLWLADLVFGIFGAISIGMGMLISVGMRTSRRQNLILPDSGSGIRRF